MNVFNKLSCLGTVSFIATACSGGVGEQPPVAIGAPAPVAGVGVGAPVAVIGVPSVAEVVPDAVVPDASGGNVPAPAVSPAGTEVAPACEAELLPRRLRALNGTQYGATLRSMFPSAENLLNPHAASDSSGEFSNGSSLRRFDFNASQQVRDNGRRLVGGGAVEQLQNNYACLAEPDSACVRTVVADLGRGLYRQPIDEEHMGKLVALFDEANAKKDTETALGFVVRAMVSSPRFLFRSEMGVPDPANPGQFRLTPHEMASAISYTLADSPPDAALKAAADDGSLADPAQVRLHAERLLAAGRSTRTGSTQFVGEYLSVGEFPTISKDEELFPGFTEEARSDLFADFEQLVDTTLSSATPTFEHLLTTRELIVRPESAELLGLGNADDFSPEGTVHTATEPGRMGVLTHPVFLATYAHENESNPVARGNFIATNILCNEVPPPPDDLDVAFPEQDPDAEPQTLRQILETKHSVGVCASCHALMDPMGYPFEAFDAVGRVRELDNNLPIDTSGGIVGTQGEVDGPVANVDELLTKIASSSLAKACFAEKTFRYVSGVDSTVSTPCAAQAVEQSFVNAEDNVPDLFVQLLTSDGFSRRTPEIAAAP